MWIIISILKPYEINLTNIGKTWENYEVLPRKMKDYQDKWRDIPSLRTGRFNIVETLILLKMSFL